ncbi:MAG: addiction module component [Deltaproteobacteria bacterium]|nr:addiction module component [Deltaproteobacteria bacterium]
MAQKKKAKQSLNSEERAFMKRHSFSKDEYINSKINIKELCKIETAYNAERDTLKAAATPFLETLRDIEEVHSLRMRIKDADHLIKKIIRKQINDKTLEITLGNYEEHIKDKIGIRVLHLYKTDWLCIHKFIINTWELWEPPFAYIREGDTDDFYKQNGCKTETHKDNYRSVHYLAKTKPMRNEISVEIQVRTLFEEGWSEIDHRIRYPDNVDNMIINQYLAIFNRLSGNADEMGTFILSLKTFLETQDKTKAVIQIELQKTNSELAEMIGKLKISKDEKHDLEEKVKNLSESKELLANKSIFDFKDSSIISADPIIGPSLTDAFTVGISVPSLCQKCGETFQSSPYIISNGLCDKCKLGLY